MGSEKISYIGLQIALAFDLGFLQGYGPSQEIDPLRRNPFRFWQRRYPPGSRSARRDLPLPGLLGLKPPTSRWPRTAVIAIKTLAL